MSILFLGGGNRREKDLSLDGKETHGESHCIDIDPNCGADIVWDLNKVPWPIPSGSYEEVHAYEILEHLGRQGDYVSFFETFKEIHRVLEPEGLLFASCPKYDSPWAWGDPGHTRIVNRMQLTFLSQRNYEEQVGKTPMADYRHIWTPEYDFVIVWDNLDREPSEKYQFILQKAGTA